METMPCYIVPIALFLTVASGTIEDRRGTGITNLTAELESSPIPSNSTNVKLDHNNIKIIPANLLKNLPVIDKLELHNNGIDNIENGAFELIPSLTDITLHKNSLFVIHNGMFTGLVNLRYVSQTDASK